MWSFHSKLFYNLGDHWRGRELSWSMLRSVLPCLIEVLYVHSSSGDLQPSHWCLKEITSRGGLMYWELEVACTSLTPFWLNEKSWCLWNWAFDTLGYQNWCLFVWQEGSNQILSHLSHLTSCTFLLLFFYFASRVTQEKSIVGHQNWNHWVLGHP